MENKYVLNDIYWVGTENGAILMPFIITSVNNAKGYLNLKDNRFIKADSSNMVKDVENEYEVDGLEYFDSYNFLLKYKNSGISNPYINILINDVFPSLNDEEGEEFLKSYYWLMNYNPISIGKIKKFCLMAKCINKNLYNRKCQLIFKDKNRRK